MNLPADAADAGLFTGLGRSPGEGNGSPLQYSCLENPMDRGAWKGTVPGVAGSDMTEQLNSSNNNVADLQCCVSFRCLAT